MASDAQPITVTPAPGQIIAHNGLRYTTVKEGLAHILVPESAKTDSEGKKSAAGGGQGVQQVFYNPIQQFNRDLSVLAIKAYGQEVIAKKEAMHAKRTQNFASKKRKRNGPENGEERPQKVEKLTDPAQTHTKDPNGADSNMSQTVAIEAGSEAQKTPEDVRAAPTTAPRPDTAASAQDNAGEAPETIAQLKPKFKILDALSATGLRALRYAHEIPFVTSVASNDLLAAAVKSINLNVEHNKLEDKITATQGDALAHMYGVLSADLAHSHNRHNSHKSEKYDVIDLDPYGTAAPFFDAAVQSVRDDGGLLCVTCTDAGVWASNGYPEKTYALYGGIPMKSAYSHEAGLRIILGSIAGSASRYGLAIEPLLSLSIDFYCRIFVKIRKSPAAVKFQAGKTMVVYTCDQGCGSWTTQLLLKNNSAPNKSGSGTFYKHTMSAGPTTDQNCEHCGFRMHIAGPMYAGRLHSPEFVQRILDDLPNVSTDTYQTTDRIRGMLQTALEEILEPQAPVGQVESTTDGQDRQDSEIAQAAVEPKRSKDDEAAAIDHFPFFFVLGHLARVLHCSTPGDDPIRGALRHLGYRVTRSHCKPGSMKTDAPWSVVWEVMREWIRQKAPIKPESIKPKTAAYKLLKMDQKKAEGGETETEGAAEDKSQLEVVFDEKLGRESSREKLVRYQMNPRENWGPMNRATGK